MPPAGATYSSCRRNLTIRAYRPPTYMPRLPTEKLRNQEIFCKESGSIRYEFLRTAYGISVVACYPVYSIGFRISCPFEISMIYRCKLVSSRRKSIRPMRRMPFSSVQLLPYDFDTTIFLNESFTALRDRNSVSCF